MTFDADGGRRRAHHREVVFFVRRGESMDRVFVVCRRGGGGRVVSSCVPNISKRCFFVYHHQKQIIRSFVRSFVRTTGCSHGVIFCTFFRASSRPVLVSAPAKKKTNDKRERDAHTHDDATHLHHLLAPGARFPRGNDEPRLPEVGIEIRHRAQGRGGGGRRTIRARVRLRDRRWRFRGPFAVPVRDREFAGGGGSEFAVR